MLLHFLGIVSGLAVVVLAAQAPGRRWLAAIAFCAALLAAAVAIGSARVPDPVWAGGFAAASAGVVLWRPRWTVFAAVASGMLASVWAAVLAMQGLPSLAAFGLVVVLAAASGAFAAHRPSFAPVAVREEGLVLVAVLALLLAVSPVIMEGWKSAAALRAAPLDVPAVGSPAWAAFAVAGGAALLGVVHSLWRRR